MLIKGEALIHSFTLPFSIHGQPGNWKVTVSGPQLRLESETREDTAYSLLDEMLTAGFKKCCQLFPQQAPPLPPMPLPKRKAFNRRVGR